MSYSGGMHARMAIARHVRVYTIGSLNGYHDESLFQDLLIS